MEDELKAVLREAFGDSTSDSDGEPSHERQERLRINDSSEQIMDSRLIFGDTHIWEPIAEIKGLWICRDFLSADQQSSLLSALEKGQKSISALLLLTSVEMMVKTEKNLRLDLLDAEGYFAETSHNQAMKFGDLPPWAIELSYNIRENIVLNGCLSKETCVFPPELLWREPLFNQFIVNIYQPGEGISAHVDLMRFEDGIAIISLESSCVMHFSSVEDEVSHVEEVKKVYIPSAKIPVLLTPGSIVLMWGEARYCWKHEINRKPQFQTWDGKEIQQKRRTSVTLRRLCQTG